MVNNQSVKRKRRNGKTVNIVLITVLSGRDRSNWGGCEGALPLGPAIDWLLFDDRENKSELGLECPAKLAHTFSRRK